MKTELGKWKPFKFLRRTTPDKPAREASANVPAPKDRPPEWQDVSRFFSGEPWRAMSEFLHEPFAGFSGLDRWFGDFSSSRFQPRIDVVDDGSSLRITVELPGMDREDLQTTIEDGALVLRGEKKQDVQSEENGCYRLERAYGAFMRSIPLPDGVDLDHVDAKFDRGVLTLRLPKTGPRQSAVRKIASRAALAPPARRLGDPCPGWSGPDRPPEIQPDPHELRDSSWPCKVARPRPFLA